MYPSPEERATNPYGMVRPRETDTAEVPWCRPTIAPNVPAPGFNSSEWHPGPGYQSEDFPWLVGHKTPTEEA